MPSAFRSCLIPLIFLILGNACSSSNVSRVHKPETLSSIKRIGLAPIALSDGDLQRYNQAERLVTLALIRSIEGHTSLKVEDPDSLLRFLSVKRGLPDNAIVAVAQKLNVDAVLFCDFQFIEDEVPGMDWTNASIALRLVETQSNHLVMESRYNTLRGNSYLEAPKIQQVVVDAVKGAVQPVVLAVRQ
ncbi:MAG: hypothetical protein KDI06_05735 [Calditrichaeota bacterium]|nr:hypothetical protein [Calditrichota bacterium]